MASLLPPDIPLAPPGPAHARTARRGERRPAPAGVGGRLRRFRPEGAAAIVLLLILWQWAAAHSSPMFFPSLGTIAATAREVFASPDAMVAIGITVLRIVLFLAAAFVLALLLGLAAAASAPAERFVVPLIELKQGIPAVCWIVFAVLWFRGMEARIGFVVVISTLPVFFYQTRDAVRAIPRDLFDMVRSLRPSAWQLFRMLVVPAMAPALLTAWRINIGNATRVAIMAELLGGISGIGQQLRQSEELFRMDQVIVWTAVLVVFVLAANQALSFVERRALKWRTSAGICHD